VITGFPRPAFGLCIAFLALLHPTLAFASQLTLTKDVPVAFGNAFCYQLPDGTAAIIPAEGACTVTTVSNTDLSVVVKHWKARRVYPLNARQSEVLLLVADGKEMTITRVNTELKVLRRWRIFGASVDDPAFTEGKLLLFSSNDTAWLIDPALPEPMLLNPVRSRSHIVISGRYLLAWSPGRGCLFKDGKLLRVIEDQLWVAIVTTNGDVVYARDLHDADEKQLPFICISATGERRELITIPSISGIILTTSPDGRYALLGNEDEFGVAGLLDGKMLWKASLPMEYSSSQHTIDNNGMAALWEIGWTTQEGTRVRTKLPVSSRLEVFGADGKSVCTLETTPRMPGSLDSSISLKDRIIDLISTTGYTRFTLQTEEKNESVPQQPAVVPVFDEKIMDLMLTFIHSSGQARKQAQDDLAALDREKVLAVLSYGLDHDGYFFVSEQIILFAGIRDARLAPAILRCLDRLNDSKLLMALMLAKAVPDRRYLPVIFDEVLTDNYCVDQSLANPYGGIEFLYDSTLRRAAEALFVISGGEIGVERYNRSHNPPVGEEFQKIIAPWRAWWQAQRDGDIHDTARNNGDRLSIQHHKHMVA